MFTRTFSCQTSMSKASLKNRLIGNHVSIHNLDFEIMEKNDNKLRIIPHAEQIDEIRTLPITYVELDESSGNTRIKITSHIRKLDAGGPMLMVILCSLLIVAGLVLFFLQEHLVSGLVLAIGIITFSVFRFNLEKSYFDYVRRIQMHVLDKTKVAI